MKDLIDRQAVLDIFKPWLEVKDYSEGELNMLKCVIHELETMPSTSAWVSVKDKLPDKCGKYMTCNKNDDYVIWYFDKENEKFGCSDYEYEVEVTHWMPLPQKPESEDAE